MAVVNRLSVLHYSVVYNFWSFAIIEPIPGVLKSYRRVTDEGVLAKRNKSGPEKLTL